MVIYAHEISWNKGKIEITWDKKINYNIYVVEILIDK